VRTADGEVQEAEGIDEWLLRVLEGIEDHLLGDLRRACAVGVSAHAVHDDEQGGVRGNRHAHPILVLLAPAQQADVRALDPQEQTHVSVSLTLYITLRGTRA